MVRGRTHCTLCGLYLNRSTAIIMTSGRPSPENAHTDEITLGRAYVRLIEATDIILLGCQPFWTERMVLQFVRMLFTRRLRKLVVLLPPEGVAEILTASDRIQMLIGDPASN